MPFFFFHLLSLAFDRNSQNVILRSLNLRAEIIKNEREIIRNLRRLTTLPLRNSKNFKSEE